MCFSGAQTEPGAGGGPSEEAEGGGGGDDETGPGAQSAGEVDTTTTLSVYFSQSVVMIVSLSVSYCTTRTSEEKSVVISVPSLDYRFITKYAMTSIDYGPSSQTLTFLDPEIDGSL